MDLESASKDDEDVLKDEGEMEIVEEDAISDSAMKPKDEDEALNTR